MTTTASTINIKHMITDPITKISQADFSKFEHCPIDLSKFNISKYAGEREVLGRIVDSDISFTISHGQPFAGQSLVGTLDIIADQIVAILRRFDDYAAKHHS